MRTPVITGSDCEGGGELFQVTALYLNNVPKSNGRVNFAEDFFGKEAHLTVSGQISLETLCLSLGRVYSFGPTFRCENSHTSRHMFEFWMIEPEVTFADLDDNMGLGQEMIRYLASFVMNECADDLGLFARFVDKNLMNTLDKLLITILSGSPIPRPLQYYRQANRPCLSLRMGERFAVRVA